MKKKVLALFLSAALCVTVLPATGMAAEFGSGDAEITENAADSQEVFSAEETTESMGETEQPAEDSEDISEEMNDTVPAYRYAQLDEVYGGVLTPAEDAGLVAVGDGKFADPVACTDSLMNVIVERLPKAANPTA